MSFLILRSSSGGGGGAAQTGLIFPANLAAPNSGETVRFKFTDAAMPDAFPLTLLFKYRPSQHDGYYTTFFWGPDGAFTGAGYYGCHPYPADNAGNPLGSSGSTHKWEVSVESVDDLVDENGHNTNVVKDGTIYDQAVVVRQSGSEIIIDFYWDLSDDTKVISRTTNSNFANGFSRNGSCLTFGDAPWQPCVERLNGGLRGLQIYAAQLSLAQINARKGLTSDAAVIAANPGSLWYCNINPTPSDITDKSGSGHHPSWQHAAKLPTLWTL